MRYVGSKTRHAKYIIPFLMNGHDQSKPYIEPFVGGGNMICHVPAKIRWGSDTAEYAIALLDAVSKGWAPPSHVTESEYHAVKANPDAYDKAYVGFVGHCCTFGGKLWGGYARNHPSEGCNSTIPAQQHKSILRQAKGLAGVVFSVGSYKDLDCPPGAAVYCDPPYAGTVKYRDAVFDHDEFWEWADRLSDTCRVFVSEYAAPPGWASLWEKSVTNTLNLNTGEKRGTEKLFVKM
jgi:DNA adenine methylase